MRELERESSSDIPPSTRLAIVGRGRLGTALAASLREAGIEVLGPLGRGADGAGVDAVLLCVPDAEIASAASLIAPGPLVGHCSGATTLDALLPHEAFSLHPLMTVTPAGASFAGAGAAVAGSTPRARALAAELAGALGMRAVEVAERDRPTYHAAASIASNFLITIQAAAERLAASAGVDRAELVPLVRAAVENWAELGAARALTGPVARGDEVTVGAQRAAISREAGDLLPLFDALAQATRDLAGAAATSDGRASSSPPGELARPGEVWLPVEIGPSSSPPGELARPHEVWPAVEVRPGREMEVVRTVEGIRAALAPARHAGKTIGLVPTMGAFHEGHLSLMRRARAECDVVVVWLFVNPTQFNEADDLKAYPRDEGSDAARAAGLGVDYLFAPSVEEIYPTGFASTVSVGGLTESLEGAARGRAHFDGVTTVITKFFNIVSPDVAYFGQKDAQQATVVKRLVRDLNMGVRIEVCETVREADGLAMSSRNVRLSRDERVRATALHRALDAAAQAVADGADDPEVVRQRALSVLAEAEIEPDYLAFVSPETLEPLQRLDGDVLALVAARVGETRLIDNQLLSTASAAGSVMNGRF